MTDQTRPMDAERLAEIRQRANMPLQNATRLIGEDIPDLLAEVARLRAVIEEVRAFEMQFTEMKMPEIRALDAILDRGLNGAGE